MPTPPELLRFIAPRRDEHDQALETRVDYASRVRQTLPNFPDEVLVQWFYDHESAISDWAWLDYASLAFSRTLLSADDLSDPCVAANDTVVQYRDHFLNGGDSPRMKRIAAYFGVHGTWPVPPILLDTRRGDVCGPGGFRCAAPYHLVEGHHRLAVWYALPAAQAAGATHASWVMRKSPDA